MYRRGGFAVCTRVSRKFDRSSLYKCKTTVLLTQDLTWTSTPNCFFLRATLKPGIRNPESGIRNPESGIRNPESGIRNPESGIRNPESGIRNPESGIRNPESVLRDRQSRHLTLTVPLYTQVYKWVPANLMLGVALRWTSIPSRGE